MANAACCAGVEKVDPVEVWLFFSTIKNLGALVSFVFGHPDTKAFCHSKSSMYLTLLHCETMWNNKGINLYTRISVLQYLALSLFIKVYIYIYIFFNACSTHFG